MNLINKFGETSNKRHHHNDSKLKTSIFKTFDISVNNQCLDLKNKRISNLISPINSKDAVTKGYLANMYNQQADQINSIKKDVEKIIMHQQNEKLYNDNKEYLSALEARFTHIEDYLFQTIAYKNKIDPSKV